MASFSHGAVLKAVKESHVMSIYAVNMDGEQKDIEKNYLSKGRIEFA